MLVGDLVTGIGASERALVVALAQLLREEIVSRTLLVGGAVAYSLNLSLLEDYGEEEEDDAEPLDIVR